MGRSLIFTGLFYAAVGAVLGQVADIGNNPRVFESDSLPTEKRMATVGNGHVATVVYSDTIYMNGLYNGEKGESHRARIPSFINVRIQSQEPVSRRYVLDTEQGIFSENLEIFGVQLVQNTFAHRLYTPLLVVQFMADFSQTALESVTFNLTHNPGPESADITFTPPRNFSQGPGKELNGTTKIVEDPRYQPDPTPVYVFFSDIPESVSLTKQSPLLTLVMSMATTYEEASEAYLEAVGWIENGMPLEIQQSHVDQWAAIWKAGNIYMEGPNLELAKVVAGSLYYLMSSLPYQEVESERRRFYGLSPGSLAKGALLNDYQGHSFWDTETWMYPPILLLWPGVAKDLLLYRMANVGPARDRANATGYKGIRFPWESGFTGVEVTPDCCPETRDNQQHITGDVAFATRQYWTVTEDFSWLSGEKYGFPLDINGCDFVRGMAEFWASRVEYNSETDQYEINGVMPPDEDHSFVNNSIYTNVIASYSILFAKEIECVCNASMTSGIPDEWLDIARKLKVPFDAQMQFHPEFDGYVIGETIKQADVVLLGYPISFVTDPVQRRNDLEIYENVTRPTGPAMTWGMHAIGYIELGEETRAESLFNRSYKPYKTEPFKVWTEAQLGSGASNFITGMGGFLQAVMSGYAGIRIRDEYLSCDPNLPNGITNLTIQGLDYLSCSIDISITEELVRVTWTGDGCSSLTISPGLYLSNMLTDPLKYSRGSLEQERKPFIIRRMDVPLCKTLA